VVAAVLIGEFRPFFGDTCTILHAIFPGMEALNDNDTWSTLGLAAARVLTQIEQKEEAVAGVEHGAQRDDKAGDDDSKRTDGAGIVRNKKRSA
jgi:hypothetical protein